MRRIALLVLAASLPACTLLLGLRDDYSIGDGSAGDSSVDASSDGGSSSIFVQSSSSGAMDATQATVTFPEVAPGDLLVVVVGWESAALMTVSDNQLHPCTPVNPSAASNGFVYQQLFQLVPDAGGVTKIIVDMADVATYIDVRVAEYHGPTMFQAAAVTIITDASVSTSIDASPGEILVAAGMANQTFEDAAGGGFTVRELTSLHNILQDRVDLDAAGQYTATGTLVGSGIVVFQVVSFK